MQNAKIGLIGLAVMGANLARNLASKNIPVLVFNRTAAKTDEFMKNFGSDPCLQAAYSLEELVQNLERPRKAAIPVCRRRTVWKSWCRIWNGPGRSF